MLFAAGVLAALFAGAASAQGYDPGPRPPYATGAYIGLGAGDPDCSFTIAGAHAGVTVLGINLGAGARVGLPGGCAADVRQVGYGQPYGPPPRPLYADQPQPNYPPQPYGYPQQGYAPPVAYPPPGPYGYPAPPCGCQPAAYRPY
jgi:hypothetical protein